ncbi:glycoside hydrolase family 2 protein [Pedobacter sp.]|jgi:mannosylglycoprotein endo-beta-mannosidase|uniref:glycoside hydrolase family 2 protein n=1 Tax=Pedobacter sp. TaxID=1411316 RepID=UPI002B917E0C|nr:glycoside hydrolase family 2 TIM barrel-domain containing protein [Pedobacter sp.]HWW39069.1 glycoside hydrolase family 2 TIM barrel-domain containing protein [Pedobacter sp.]
MKKLVLTLLLIAAFHLGFSQNRYELNSEWKCLPLKQVQAGGEQISATGYALSGWKPATVPGTVLTTMLNNKEVPDPFYGMNNEKIPDIYVTGRDYYTYWFVKDFKETATAGQQVWLNFRGINYSCDIFLNGKKVNRTPYKGMFIRKAFNITSFLNKDGKNRLAVIVYPADVVGDPNGGQGGDGTIARGVAPQYTAGWDWIRPIRDRNTGIWDKVYIEKTGAVNLKNPHVITYVPGKRNTEGPQQPARIRMSAELENTSGVKMDGVLSYIVEGQKVSVKVSVPAGQTTEVQLPDFELKNPRLWWPNGYGKQELYKTNIQFTQNNGQVSDQEALSFGVREIQTTWNTTTNSKEILVNGQKIFIKGGNWIISDAMLRFSQARYDAEIRYHKDMNLNLIRIWGGALVERPEFYDACDRNGLLVMQDFWMSGDCNGRWQDPAKKDDQWTRRQYPDDHHLFLESATDMIKMVRNHASLAIWCGGNEITPPNDILVPLRDSILPKLDGTRWFIDYSNSDEMSLNTIGGNGDGPYTIQPISTFWENRTFPFNSEVGSVGVGDYESLQRFIPEKNLIAPEYTGKDKHGRAVEKIDSVWTYHTYDGVGYEAFILPYGKPENAKDFATKAQLVNYDQYRGLIEGFSSHMWNWYTGVIIWKTQNPWTSTRGQMYDYYLDPNACLYGLRSGSEMLHSMYNPVDGMVSIANNGFQQKTDLMLVATSYDMKGKSKLLNQIFCYIEPSTVKKISSLKPVVDALSAEEGSFLSLQLLDRNKKVVSDNFYWIPDQKGNYSGLNRMQKTTLKVSTRQLGSNKVEVTLINSAQNPVAFFNRIALVDAGTKQRILPAFYDDNYVSLPPGAEKKVVVEYTPDSGKKYGVTISGWNVESSYTDIR